MSLDAIAPNYLRARELWPDAELLARYYEKLQECAGGDQVGMLETVKTYVECVCRTVIRELNATVDKSSPTTSELLSAAFVALGLETEGYAAPLGRVLTGFRNITDALADVRKSHGYIAHGKDAYFEALSTDHSRAYIHVGDVVLASILRAYEGMVPDFRTTRADYDQFRAHHARIDSAVSVEAAVEYIDDQPLFVLSFLVGDADPVVLQLEPSRVLYGVDREAYRDLLERAGLRVPAEISPEYAVALPWGFLRKTSGSAGQSRLVGVVESYRGPLEPLAPDLGAFLHGESRVAGLDEVTRAHLRDSILVTLESEATVDWMARESVRARLRVVLRRLLVALGFAPHGAIEIAAALLHWLEVEESAQHWSEALSDEGLRGVAPSSGLGRGGS